MTIVVPNPGDDPPIEGEEKGAIFALLGKRPDKMAPDTSEAVVERVYGRRLVLRDWPETLEGMTFMHRAFGQLLRARGLTVGSGLAIRRELQSGQRRAVIIMEDGREVSLEPTRWRGAASRKLFWTGRSEEPLGDVYILDAVPDAAGGNAQGPRDDITERERNTVSKIILGMAMDTYGYVPNGGHSGTAREIAKVLEDRGLSVTDDTIRKYLNIGVELYDPAKDETRSA